MRIVFRYALWIVFAFLIVEFLAFGYFGMVMKESGWRPDYANKDTTSRWRTESDLWGAWHLPNAQARHFSPCFDVAVRSNSYGARDRERSLEGENRILVIGDSYIEGWGVLEERRFTNLMEKQLQREVLNFGTNDFFGPLQYEILYRELASNFDHNLLIIGLAPHNDFTDNDLEQWLSHQEGRHLSRYRPYYSDDGMTAIYTVKQPPKGVSKAELPFYQPFGIGKLKAIGRSYFWSYGWVRLAKSLVGRRSAVKSSGNINPYSGYSGYRDFKEQQLRNVLGSLERIRKIADKEQRDILLALLPSRYDFEIRRSENLLAPIIEEFGAKHDIRVIDVLDAMDYREDYFQTCNWFWSENGHRKVADILSNEVAQIVDSR